MGFLDFIFKSRKVKTKSPEELQSGISYIDGDEFKREEVPLSDEIFYNLAKKSDVLSMIFSKRNEEVFRNGFTIETKNKREKELIEKTLFKKCNKKYNSLKEELEYFSYDLDVTSKGYLLIIYEYEIDDKCYARTKISEIRRIKPTTIKSLINKQGSLGYSLEGEKLYVDIEDRSEVSTEKHNSTFNRPNLEAHFCIESGDKKMYYNKEEIIFKYINRGVSLITGIQNKVISLMNIDEMIKIENDPEQERSPKKLLFVPTTNYESLRKWWKTKTEDVRKNPNKVHPTPYNSNGNNVPTVIDLSTGQEVTRIDIVSDFWLKIGAVFGVSPVFQNDASTGGGLNNEGLQIKITNRAIEFKQNIINMVLKEIFDIVKVDKNLKICLNPSEEKDLVYEEQLLSTKLQNARTLLELGVDVKLDKDKNLIFKETDLEIQPERNPFEEMNQQGQMEGQQQGQIEGQQQGQENMSDEEKEFTDYVLNENKEI